MLSMYNVLTGTEQPANSANRLVVVPAVTTTLTITQAAHSGKIVQLQSTGGLAVTLPPATGTGAEYKFFYLATISGGSVTFDGKPSSDIFYGLAMLNKQGTAFAGYSLASTANLITMDGTTRGGIIGDLVELTDMGTHVWWVRITGNQSGTVASPFTNH